MTVNDSLHPKTGAVKISPLKKAYALAEPGLPVIPCCPPDHAGMSDKHLAVCKSPGKAPLITGWQTRTVTTPEDIDKWLRTWPTANLGLPLGNASRLVGADIDGTGGERLYAEWSGDDDPDTWEFVTARGRRKIFRLPEGVTLKKFSKAGPGGHQELALLGEGQQTVLPPSVHHDGPVYKWAPGRDPWSFGEPAPAPEWMIARMTRAVVDIDTARSHQEAPSDSAAVLDKLVGHCAKFAQAVQGQERGIDEETWFQWVSLLVAAGYPDAAHRFSALAPKHDQRSISRINVLVSKAETSPVPPARCSTIGCILAEIETCHKKIVSNQAGECTNTPAFWIRERIRERKTKPTAVDPDSYFKRDHNGKITFIPKRLADEIMNNNHFRYTTGAMYAYNNGVYRPGGEHIIASEIHRLLTEEVRNNRVSEVMGYIEREKYTEIPEPQQEYINVLNGRLDWISGRLLPHDPGAFDIIQLPVKYDENASCPRIDEFLEQVLPPDSLLTIEEFIGYCMIPYTAYEKALMLVGEGGNGKGTFINLMTAFLGRDNISSIPLQELADHRFKRAELFGKIGNMFADLNKQAIQDTGYLKMIATGDTIDGERKHKDPFSFRPYARMIFSANEIPRSLDTSQAYYDRWIIVPFPNRFRGANNENRSLIDEMTTPEELSGFLNKAIVGLTRLFDNNNFSVSDSVNNAMKRYMLHNENVKAFIEECLDISDTEYFEYKSEVYKAYKQWCIDGGLKPISQMRFSEALQKQPTFRAGRRTFNTPRGWYGVKIRQEEIPEYYGSLNSHT